MKFLVDGVEKELTVKDKNGIEWTADWMDINNQGYVHYDKENNIYTFIVKNSLDKSVISENPKLKTTKKDIINHGLGTSIIRDIVNKYSGRYDYYEIDNAFCCSIILET
jgi:hypothetical protein